MKFKYYLWIRWKSGARDCFELTKDAFDFWKNGGNGASGDYWELSTPTGELVFLDASEIAAYKLIKKEINPLNDEDHYEDPLN